MSRPALSRPHAFTSLLVALLIPLLGFTWLAGEKQVSVMVNGEVRQVRTYAATVDELLDRLGVERGPEDQIVPAAGTALSDGMVVELVHARPITLLVGDVERRVMVTALDVNEVLRELGTEVGRRDIVRPSRLARVVPGMVVEVRRPVAIQVLADGRSHDVITDARTVAGVLERLNIALGPEDRVLPGLDAAPVADGRIVVQRITRATETRVEAIDFATVKRRNPDLPKGQERVVEPGKKGLREVTEEVVRADGKVESRRALSERVVRAPVDRVVEVGTKTVERTSPRPANTSGRTPNTQEGKASWYDHPGNDPMTAAHRTLPFGTMVTVTNLANGKTVTVRINDRGPFVEGRIIDLNREAFQRIAPTSAGVLRVRITW
ncbi:MAG TPA: septal ring lytic transglycosylase RlpA family protein [Egibacteraceae bacterium]|nr:septal ring lytic transglycosylase RlpA family protein [Egibacteraceae bacterium]